MKKWVSLLLCLALLFGFQITVNADNEEKTKAETNFIGDMEIDAKSALLMEASTGEVLFAKNAETSYSPASVTKIMTLLLVMEAIDAGTLTLDQKLTVSDAAASKGGSQVFLEEGEEMTVEELLKCTVIASANDAAVALAEAVAGNEAAFVSRMNERAKELGMTGTNFENATGLDDTVENHVTSAKDIAIMSRELISHEKILAYSSLWQDSIRGGEFVLTNTNRLVRFYKGCNGLKTGSTSTAGFCMAATATRDGMTLIAVVMGAPTRDARNQLARTLLDAGFARAAVYRLPAGKFETVRVLSGKSDWVDVRVTGFSALVAKGMEGKVEVEYHLPTELCAPLAEGDKVGTADFTLDGKPIGSCDIVAGATVAKIGFFEFFARFFSSIFSVPKK